MGSGETDKWIDGWTDGWMDRRTERWMNGWVEGWSHQYLSTMDPMLNAIIK